MKMKAWERISCSVKPVRAKSKDKQKYLFQTLLTCNWGLYSLQEEVPSSQILIIRATTVKIYHFLGSYFTMKHPKNFLCADASQNKPKKVPLVGFLS